MSLTKAQMVDSLCANIGLSKADARVLVDNFFAEIAIALVAGDMVKLSGFGNFTIRNKKERPGLNPRTGAQEVVSARRVVTFKAGQRLKESVQNVYNHAE